MAVNSVGSDTSNASSTTSKSPISVSGLISGIDSASIIDAFVKADGAATRIIERQKSLKQAKLDAVRSFNTKVLSAQLGLNDLKKSATFQKRQAVSSLDTALAVSSTSTSAVPGTYTLDVTQVAKAHQSATAGTASATAPIGVGTVSVKVGSAPATILDFSAGGSLNDVATAINGANLGAIASVVNDGTGTPYRLVLQATKTGTANNLVVSGTGDFDPLFSNMATLTESKDAKVRVGGTGGFTITQASNTFSDVIPGVSLVAKTEQNGVAITVSSDAMAAKEKITTFVKDLNTAITYFNQNSKYDSTTKQGGVLITESALRSQLGAIQRSFSGAVPGLPTSMNNITALGITIDQKEGTFTVDDAKLTAALSDNADGVMRLFTNSGTSSNSAVQFSYVSSQTKVDQPFAVNITQAASQAVVAATGDLAVSTDIYGSNDRLNLTINGSPLSLTLAHGLAYTRSQLAELVQTTINAAIPNQGAQVSASITGNRLDLRSTMYGSTHTIQVMSSSTATAALGLATTQAVGLDVTGTINGVAAVGNGQLMKGGTGTPAEGLSLLVTATVPISGVSVTARKGLAQQTGDIFSRLTNGTSGIIVTEDVALTNSIDDMNNQITKKNALLETRKLYYQAQFAAMEKMIAQFQGQASYLTQFSNANTSSSSK